MCLLKDAQVRKKTSTYFSSDICKLLQANLLQREITRDKKTKTKIKVGSSSSKHNIAHTPEFELAVCKICRIHNKKIEIKLKSYKECYTHSFFLSDTHTHTHTHTQPDKEK